IYDIEFTNGSILSYRLASTTSAESLRGRKADLVVCDEFALYTEKVWSEILEPLLATTNYPKALFISTPRGRGQFYEFFHNKDSKWKSFHFPSESNPLVSKEFLSSVKTRVSQKVYKQE